MMHLVFAPNSPIARKYRILVREKGLADRIVETETIMRIKETGETPHAFQQAATVVTPQGIALMGSLEICAFLDAVGAEPRAVPAGETEAAAVKRLDLLADGALGFAVQLYLDRQSDAKRSEQEQQLTERNRKAILIGLDAAEKMSPKPTPINVGVVSTAVLLSFLDRYVPDLAWKKDHPKLAALQTALEERPSFRETRPT